MFWFHLMKAIFSGTQWQNLNAYECESVAFRDLVSRMAVFHNFMFNALSTMAINWHLTSSAIQRTVMPALQ